MSELRGRPVVDVRGSLQFDEPLVPGQHLCLEVLDEALELSVGPVHGLLQGLETWGESEG